MLGFLHREELIGVKVKLLGIGSCRFVGDKINFLSLKSSAMRYSISRQIKARK